jgi:hypothetical protein
MTIQKMPSIKPIWGLILRTKLLLRSSWIATGLATLLAVFFTALLAAGMLDLLFTLWVSMRWCALALVVLPTTAVLGGGVLWPAVRRLGSQNVARRIEQHIPHMHNRLVSCVDLALERKNRAASPLFRRRLIEEALERIRGFRPARVLDLSRLKQAALAALATLAVFLVVVVLLRDRLPTALARVFRPWADIPPASGVRYSVAPGEKKVLRGDDLEFAAQVEKGEPDDLELEVLPDGGRPVRYEMRRRDGRTWTLALHELESSFSYRVVGGGTWSLPYRVTVVDRPRIATLQATLRWPKYFGPVAPRPNPPETADVSGPEQSEVELSVGVEGDVSRGEIRLFGVGPRQELGPAASYPLQPAQGKWTGRFPLATSGFYRVHVENELGAANQTMKEARLTAIPDRPPQIVLERPAGDLTVSAPQKIPLAVSAFDDFALDELTLLTRRSETGKFTEQRLKHYPDMVRRDSGVFSLDLYPYQMKPGEQVRYYLQARDRKGQTAVTPELSVRMVADENAADRQLARAEKAEDALQEKLRQLIARQTDIHQNVEQMASQHAPLAEEIRQAKLAARKAADASSPTQSEPAVPLSPQTAQKLEELRKELARLAGRQQQAANEAQQIAGQLQQSAEQAEKSQLLPPEVLSEMHTAATAMDRQAVLPMQQAAGQMREASANRQATAPDLPELNRVQKRLEEELNSLLARLKSLQEARQKLGSGMEEALKKVREEAARQQASLERRNMEELHHYLGALEKELAGLEQQQDDYLASTAKLPSSSLPHMEKQQSALEKKESVPLAEAEVLLTPDGPRRLTPAPQSPDAPSAEQGEEYMVPSKAEDAPRDAGKTGKTDGKAQPDTPKNSAGKEDRPSSAQRETPTAEREQAGGPPKEKSPSYEPALGGPKPSLDPRIAQRQPPSRPQESPPKPEPGKPGQDEQPPTPPANPPTNQDSRQPAQAKRESLQSRQFEKLKELDQARQSVATDAQSLGKLLEQSRQDPAGARQSSAMRQARAMAERMQAARMAGQSRAGQHSARPQGPSHGADPRWLSRGAVPDEKELEKRLLELDPATRTVILKMQPRVREEILQGMREAGPEGYRQFIRDYFQRLTEVGGK